MYLSDISRSSYNSLTSRSITLLHTRSSITDQFAQDSFQVPDYACVSSGQGAVPLASSIFCMNPSNAQFVFQRVVPWTVLLVPFRKLDSIAVPFLLLIRGLSSTDHVQSALRRKSGKCLTDMHRIETLPVLCKAAIDSMLYS